MHAQKACAHNVMYGPYSHYGLELWARSHQTSSKMCSKTSNYVRNNFIALGSIVHIKILNPKGIWVPKMHAHKSCETHDFGAW